MPTNLLILPLLAGFWFLHFCHYFRYRSQTLDGYRLLIESAIAGSALSFVARILTYVFWNKVIAHDWAVFAPFEFSGTASVAMMIGVGLPFLLNHWWDKDVSKQRAIKAHGNDLLRLLDGAVRQEKPVSITLDNRKVYIGYVVNAPNLDPKDAYVALLPILSGYRDASTMQLKFTTDYSRVYESSKANPADFFVTMPLAVIRMANLFDENIYSAFRVEETMLHASGTPATPLVKPAT